MRLHLPFPVLRSFLPTRCWRSSSITLLFLSFEAVIAVAIPDAPPPMITTVFISFTAVVEYIVRNRLVKCAAYLVGVLC